MAQPADFSLTVDAGAVASIAAELEAAGMFTMDLEFVSEGRYVPELALVQVAWGNPREPRTAAIDPLATELGPVFDLVARDDVQVISHAAKQDLSLLGTLGIRARGFMDTQIAAAFAGYGEQVGYARLIQRILGTAVDKGPQYTDWMRRPLSEAQLRYAIDDVRLLQGAWASLRAALEERGRLAWVREESETLAAACATRPDPDEMYRQLGGWANLKPPALGALKSLSAWREREALSSNTPPSWILVNRAVVELCKRGITRPKDIARVRGVGHGTVRKYGDAIADAVRQGMSHPIQASRPDRPVLDPRSQAWSACVTSLISSRCASEGVAPRFVGGRSDADALVAWFEGKAAESTVALLAGWRRQFVGEEALSWLRGEIAIAIDRDASGGLKTLRS